MIKGEVKSIHINPTLIPALLFTFECKKGNAKNMSGFNFLISENWNWQHGEVIIIHKTHHCFWFSWRIILFLSWSLAQSQYCIAFRRPTSISCCTAISFWPPIALITRYSKFITTLVQLTENDFNFVQTFTSKMTKL